MAITSWLALGHLINTTELKGTGADKVRGRRVVNEFCSWAEGQALPFPSLDYKAPLAEFAKTLEGLRNTNGELNKDGRAAMAWAEELLKRSQNPEPQKTTTTGAVEAPTPEEEMAKKPAELDEELDNELDEVEEDDPDFEGEEDDEDEEEQPEPPKRRAGGRAVNNGQQPIIVQLPPGMRGNGRGGRQSRAAEPRGSKAGRLLQQDDMLRVYKRDDRGKVVVVDDYSLKDVGNSKLNEFIEEVVHPRFGNEATPFTDYIVFEVDKRSGDDKGHGVKVRIEDEQEGPAGGPSDPFATVTRAMDLVKQLKGEPEPVKRDPAMAMLKERAATSGDMNGVIMMMLLDKVMGAKPQQDTELVMRLVERLDRLEGKGPAQPLPPQLPPWMMQPPAPPQSSGLDKVVDLAVSNLVKPPPSMFEQAKEMATLRELFAPKDTEAQALRAELAQLRQQLAGGGGKENKDGFGAAMENFERVTTMVKSFAPQVVGESSGGGFGGFVKGLMTPEVGKAIAGAITGAQQQAQAPQQPAQPQQPVQVGPVHPQAQQPAVRDPNKPPNPPPQGVVDAAKAFQAAMTVPMRAEKFADFMFAMFTSGDPYYQKMLEPVVQQLSGDTITAESLKPARRLGMLLVAEQKSEWATPEFIDACIAALAAKAGIETPAVLVETRSRWTLDFRGEVLMLDAVAKPVEVPTPTPAALPATSPQPAPKPTPTPALATGPIPDFPAAEPLSEVPADRKLRPAELVVPEPVEVAAVAVAKAEPRAQPRR